jgi:hypothetical protein
MMCTRLSAAGYTPDTESETLVLQSAFNNSYIREHTNCRHALSIENNKIIKVMSANYNQLPENGTRAITSRNVAHVLH